MNTDTTLVEQFQTLLPEYKITLSIEHNSFKSSYMTVTEAIGVIYNVDNFPDQAEIDKCIASDSVWEIHWYPDTPVGFCSVCAATLAKALELTKQV